MLRAIVPVMLLWVLPVSGQALEEINFDRTVVLFYSDDCPHCHHEIEWLNDVRDDFPALEFLAFEIGVSRDPVAQELFRETMELRGSNTSAWPRTVIGSEVYIGFSRGSGQKIWSAPHRAFIGYENQLYRAMARMNAAVPGFETGPVVSPATDDETAGTISEIHDLPFVLTVLAIPAVALVGVLLLSRRYAAGSAQRRYLWGGFVMLAIGVLFVLLARIPDAGVTALADRVPFPFFLAIVAIADGFNPCAFAVLFILLSLLTYTRSRRRMAMLGGTFVGTSAVMYGAMILFLVVFGAFLLERIGTLLFQIFGSVVLVIGLVNGVAWIRNRSPQLALTAKQTSRFGRKAAHIVERLNLARGPLGTVSALAGTVALAVLVNLIEVGCTAILPVVFVSTLLSRYGPAIALPHVLWTLLYGILYVLPMILILVNFVFTFRSRRLSERAGRALKGANAVLMLLLGGYLVLGG